MRDKLLAAEKVILCIIRKWWRPVTCIWLSATMAMHGVIVPTVQMMRGGEVSTNLMELAALVTAVTAAFAVREWGKVMGVDNAVED